MQPCLGEHLSLIKGALNEISSSFHQEIELESLPGPQETISLDIVRLAGSIGKLCFRLWVRRTGRITHLPEAT